MAMVVNKRKRLGIGVLAVGLAALIIDRAFVLPKSAPAGPADFTDDYTIARSESIPTVPPITQSVIPAGCQKLERAWSDKSLSIDCSRDPFRIPDSWQRQSGPDTGGGTSSAAAAMLVGTHKLEAVVIDSRGDYALVDGTLLRLGDEMDGFRLVAIDRESATLQRNEERVELKLAGDQ